VEAARSKRLVVVVSLARHFRPIVVIIIPAAFPASGKNAQPDHDDGSHQPPIDFHQNIVSHIENGSYDFSPKCAIISMFAEEPRSGTMRSVPTHSAGALPDPIKEVSMIIAIKRWTPIRFPHLAVRRAVRAIKSAPAHRPGIFAAWQTMLEAQANLAIKSLD
jgi:hypothetical protein